MKFRERRLEPFFQNSNYVAEFWNTISNFPFMIIAILRLIESHNPPYINQSQPDLSKIGQAYTYLFFVGLGSSIHHATTPKWTIIIDWIPILGFIYHIITTFDLYLLSNTVIFELFLSLTVLFIDHSTDIIPVPWGHVFWHPLAAISLDSMIQNFANKY